MSSTASSPPSAAANNLHSLFETATPSLVSGACQAVLFNPFDRALFVRTQNRRRRFFDWKNFEHPFQGFANAAVYRTICGACYVFWQDSAHKFFRQYTPHFSSEHYPVTFPVVLGLITGTLNGISLNNLQAVKFRMWSHTGVDPPPGFVSTAKHMYQTGGTRVFFRGLVITVQRDAVYGIVYETLRRCRLVSGGITASASACHRLWKGVDSTDNSVAATTSNSQLAASPNKIGGRGKPKKTLEMDRTKPRDVQFEAVLANFIASVIATACSSPFNYIRSLAYGAPVNAVPLKMRHLGKSLFVQMKYIYLHGESFAKIVYQDHPDRIASNKRYPIQMLKSLNSRLNIGWGSIRVGLGMSIGQAVFSFVQAAMTC